MDQSQFQSLTFISKTISFEVDGQPYMIVQCSAEAARAYKDKTLSELSVDPGTGTITKINKFGDSQMFLISKCLKRHKANQTDKYNPVWEFVPIEDIKNFPEEAVEFLFPKCLEHSGLSKPTNETSTGGGDNPQKN